MLKKSITAIALCSGLLTLPAIALASDMTIVNGTTKPFSVSVNNHCSSVFGLIQPGQNRLASEYVLSKMCGQNTTNCETEIHRNTHCSGDIIAKFNFDVKTGITGQFTTEKPYKVNIDTSKNVFVLYEEVK